MELPQKLTSDLRIIQNQMKLAIQTHQIMRIKQINEPTNFKILDDLRDIEKRISSLGEKQNQLMRWLRKQLTSNGTLMAKTIAAKLGFAANGTHQCSVASQPKMSNNILVPKTCNSSVCTPIKDQITTNNAKTVVTVQRKVAEEAIKIEPKDKCSENVNRITRDADQLSHSMRVNVKSVKQSIQTTHSGNKSQKDLESSAHTSEPLTLEKERFLSAVGLVTREILKELQNRRVERKRRSTANHTQFVYGSSWEISSKKRKKSNYLASTLKQPITRQAVRAQSHKTEPSQIAHKVDQSVLIFKAPLPVSVQIPPQSVDLRNTSNATQKTVVKNLTILSSNDVCEDRLGTAISQQKKGSECNAAQSCIVCHKHDAGTIACSCNMYYHPSCAEKIENCVGCGIKIKSNIGDRRAEKHRLQEMNNRLNREKQLLETRAAELNDSLGTQAKQKKSLLAMEETLRKKIQHIHNFVTLLKSSQSLSSS